MSFIEEYTNKAEAENLRDKIIKLFSKFGIWIAVASWEIYGQWFVFKLKLKRNTREAQIHARIPDVQFRLEAKKMILLKAGQELLLAVTNSDIKYDSLPVILKKYFSELCQLHLPYPVGFTVVDQPIMIDLAEVLHLLIGGASGSGKSVSLQTQIASVAYTKDPAEVNFVLIDTGAADLMCFEGLPHLCCPIIQSQEGAIRALAAVEAEMKRRVELERTNPDEYAVLPRLLVVIDEYPALFSGLDSTERNALRDTISSLLQRGRHAKIHMILAAQNPTAHQMRSDIGNITTRVAFRCAKKNYSEIILGEAGAENLAGKGDLLIKAPQFNGTVRLQGVYATPDELRQIVNQIIHRPYNTSEDGVRFTIPIEVLNSTGQMDTPDIHSIPPVKWKASAEKQLLARVVHWALSRDSISVNKVTEQFHVGWKRADRLVAELDELGIVDELDAKLPRNVMPTEVSDLPSEMLDFLARNGISEDDVCQAFNYRKT